MPGPDGTPGRRGRASRRPRPRRRPSLPEARPRAPRSVAARSPRAARPSAPRPRTASAAIPCVSCPRRRRRPRRRAWLGPGRSCHPGFRSAFPRDRASRSPANGGTSEYHRRVQDLLRFLRRPVVAIAVVTAAAGALRLYHLGQPPVRVFDEVYYSKDGCLYAGYTPRQCDLTSSGERLWVITERATRGETSWVHPQLGKWAIAAGIKGMGNG